MYSFACSSGGGSFVYSFACSFWMGQLRVQLCLQFWRKQHFGRAGKTERAGEPPGCLGGGAPPALSAGGARGGFGTSESEAREPRKASSVPSNTFWELKWRLGTVPGSWEKELCLRGKLQRGKETRGTEPREVGWEKRSPSRAKRGRGFASRIAWSFPLFNLLLPVVDLAWSFQIL